MTVDEIRKACMENKYICLRNRDGCLEGINCGVAFTSKMKSKLNIESKFIGFYPISFMEYISIKLPFIT